MVASAAKLPYMKSSDLPNSKRLIAGERAAAPARICMEKSMWATGPQARASMGNKMMTMEASAATTMGYSEDLEYTAMTNKFSFASELGKTLSVDQLN